MVKQQGSLAEKLERLFDEVRKPNGSKYTQTEVVKGTNDVLTRVYLWKLRTGRATNPGFHIIQAIAHFFEVDPRYFFESEEPSKGSTTEEPTLVDKIALRSGELDEEGRQTVLNMIDYILEQRKRGQTKKPRK
jgi:transcriptional regulator with XRE-family HTH domain